MGELLEDLVVDAFIKKQVGFYLDNGEPLNAINFIWPILLKDKENPHLNTLLGAAYCHAAELETEREGHIANAKLYLGKALEINEDAFLPRYYLARVFIAEHKYEDALGELNELLSRGHEKEQVYQGISALRQTLNE